MEPGSPLSSDPPPPPPPPGSGAGASERRQFTELPGAGAGASSEWDLPSGPSASAPGRSSILLWVLAAVNILAFGTCSAVMAVLAAMPPEELRKAMPQISAEQVAQVHLESWPLVVLMMALGFLPGVIYLIVAFPVRKGKPLGINLAMTIVLTQAIVTGVLLLDNIVRSVADGNPVELTVAVLILGTYLAVLVYALVWLWRARVGAYRGADEFGG